MWCARLEVVGDELAGALLSSDERERGAQILDPLRRGNWTSSRAVLRDILGRYAHEHPGRLKFAAGPGGKPRLADAGPPHWGADADGRQANRDLRFNLSHSRSTALYAIAAGLEVGVDIEWAGSPPRPRADGGSATSLRRPPCSGRRESVRRDRELLLRWTLHEAALKCSGSSVFARSTPSPHPAWVSQLAIGPSGVAALAAESQPSEVRCFEWEPRPPTARALEVLRANQPLSEADGTPGWRGCRGSGADLCAL